MTWGRDRNGVGSVVVSKRVGNAPDISSSAGVSFLSHMVKKTRKVFHIKKDAITNNGSSAESPQDTESPLQNEDQCRITPWSAV